MKYALLLFVGVLLVSCGTKIPFTSKVKDEFGLDNDKSMAKVQFYTSATIKLQSSRDSGNQGTTSDGTLISSSNSEQDIITIPIGTKCIFEEQADGNITVRFEPGVGHTISFGMRQGQSSGKYYLLADWKAEKGGAIEYGGKTYYATTSSGTAYLQVVKKKLAKTKKKERFVNGMKV